VLLLWITPSAGLSAYCEAPDVWADGSSRHPVTDMGMRYAKPPLMSVQYSCVHNMQMTYIPPIAGVAVACLKGGRAIKQAFGNNPIVRARTTDMRYRTHVPVTLVDHSVAP
jgi:hypothetical protein